jgi:carbonic anhydrase/acetyltransferase-like protein (isoleucine patch superfamily)
MKNGGVNMKTSNKLILGLTVSSIVGKVIKTFSNKDNVTPNTTTTFNLNIDKPTVNHSAYIHHFASVIGSVNIGENVFVGPFSSLRGDEGLRIHIGNGTNVQDGVVLHGLKNYEYQSVLANNSVFKENQPYSIYIGDQVTLAQQCQVHGPARIDNKVFIGMQCLVFDSYVQESVVLEPASKVIGVTIPRYRYVAAGKVITNQDEADQLPEITSQYQYYDFNQKIISVNKELVEGYKRDDK